MYNILCIDSIHENFSFLESLFKKHKKNYNIVIASEKELALSIISTNQINLILLDVTIFKDNEFEIAQSIIKKYLDIPIIFLADKRDEETIRNAFKYGVDYLSKPYNHFELFARIETQLKLINTKNELKKQVEFSQSILDSQNNIVFIQNNNGLIHANKKFLEFFKVNSVDEFNSSHKCVSELFMEYENYFALKVLNNNKYWINHLYENENTDYNILLMDTDSFEPKAFRIDVNNIKDTDMFVVTLIDITKITTESKRFETKANYDALTSVYNRSKFNEIIKDHYNIFDRYNVSLSFAIFDIDFFKKVNDEYGHIAGDEVLTTFAQIINKATRNTDIFARWGGEEFVLLMPETKINDAFIAVDNLRRLIEETEFKNVKSITCSVGVTQFHLNDTINDVLKRADEALYEAKENGRNKVYKKIAKNTK